MIKKEEFELLSLLDEELKYFKYNKFNCYFRDEDYGLDPVTNKLILSRHSYPIHWKFFQAGKKYKERFFDGANRSGKTLTALFEWTCHLTGKYPKNWDGYRYTRPILLYCLGKNNESTRDVIQKGFVGDFKEPGTGLIPKSCLSLSDIKPRTGVPNAISYIRVKHYSNGKYDGDSEVHFRSYLQGDDPLMGISCDGIWFDEEPPMDIYSEGIIRTMDRKGLIMTTFTPLKGYSEVVKSMLPMNQFPTYDENLNYIPINDQFKDYNKYVAHITWDNAPHLSEEEKKYQWNSCPPYLRNARSKGIPAAGLAQVYPIDLDDIFIKPFDIPLAWPRCAGLDVGWNRTAAVWGAIDPNTDVMYVYSEYTRGQCEPIIHAKALKDRETIDGIKPFRSWIPVAIDPAARGSSQIDGMKIFELYEDQDLYLVKAVNAVDAGIYTCFQRMSGGKTKFFDTLQGCRSEMSGYQYKTNGAIDKKDDHLMDAYRYMEMTTRDMAEEFQAKLRPQNTIQRYNSDSMTGY